MGGAVLQGTYILATQVTLSAAPASTGSGVLTYFTDNSGPWRAMFDAQAARTNDGSSPNVVRVRATSHLPPSVAFCYGFSTTPQVMKPGITQGGPHAGWYRHTCLQSPKDRAGLFVNGTNTWLAPYTSGPVNAAFSTIQNLTIIGGNVDASGFSVTRSAHLRTRHCGRRSGANQSVQLHGGEPERRDTMDAQKPADVRAGLRRLTNGRTG